VDHGLRQQRACLDRRRGDRLRHRQLRRPSDPCRLRPTLALGTTREPQRRRKLPRPAPAQPMTRRPIALLVLLIGLSDCGDRSTSSTCPPLGRSLGAEPTPASPAPAPTGDPPAERGGTIPQGRRPRRADPRPVRSHVRHRLRYAAMRSPTPTGRRATCRRTARAGFTGGRRRATSRRTDRRLPECHRQPSGKPRPEQRCRPGDRARSRARPAAVARRYPGADQQKGVVRGPAVFAACDLGASDTSWPRVGSQRMETEQLINRFRLFPRASPDAPDHSPIVM
jgi:hypothetical protein